MSPAEKKTFLDKQIDRTQQFQNAMAKGKAPTASTGNGGGPGAAKGPQTPEDRERHRQQRLDHSTPEFRAQTDVFRRDLEQRRKERGLAPSPAPGRRTWAGRVQPAAVPRGRNTAETTPESVPASGSARVGW